MEKELKKTFRIAVLYPSLFTIVGITIFSIIENYNYTSEWVTKEFVIFLSIIHVLIYSGIFCLLSLPIFLNKFEKIRINVILRILTWFLLPFGFIICVYQKYRYLTYSNFIYDFILNFPFIVGLIYSYIRFSRYYDKTKNDNS